MPRFIASWTQPERLGFFISEGHLPVLTVTPAELPLVIRWESGREQKEDLLLSTKAGKLLLNRRA